MIWDLIEAALALYAGFLLGTLASRVTVRKLAPDPFDAYLREVAHTCDSSCFPDRDSHWIAERKLWVRR